MSPNPPGPQSFGSATLLDVLPIGASVEAAGRELTVASIERYPAGFVVALSYEEPAERAGAASILDIDARDDRGRRYAGQLLSGHGGGSPGGSTHHRMLYGFTPALAADATMLTLDGIDAAIDLTGYRHAGPPGWAPFPAGEAWSVEVPLQPVPREPDESGDPGWADFVARNLRRVVPSGARQTIRDVSLAACSIELYASGFVVLAAIEYPGQPMLVNGPPDWSAIDDLGASFRCFDWAGSGQRLYAGRSGWRLDLMFAPALNPEARRLTLRLDGVTLRYDERQVPPVFHLSQRGGKVDIAGPWELVIDLVPGKG